jgi:hypothetical protein
MPEPQGVQPQFTVLGPYKHGDGSYKFTVALLVPSPIAGGVPDLIGTAEVHINNDKACIAMAGALVHISKAIPPDLTLINGGKTG